MKFYADKFKKIRQSNRVSMQKAAKFAGITRVSLWAWEKGRRIPSEANIRALARALNIEVTEISDLKPVKEIIIKDFSTPVQAFLEVGDFDTEKRTNTIQKFKQQIDMLDNKLKNAFIIKNALISSLDTPFYIKDTNLRYIIANNSFLKMLKLNINTDIIGKKDINLFPVKEAKYNTAQDLEVISSGKPITGTENFIPGTRKLKWGIASKTPIFEKTGNIIGVTGIFVDITERKKKTDDALKKSDEKFRLIFDNAIDGMALAELESRKFVLANKKFCSMLGYNQEEITNLHVMDVHARKDLPYVMEQFEKQAKGEFSLARNLPVMKKDGSIFLADIRAGKVELDGKPYILGIFRDITEH